MADVNAEIGVNIDTSNALAQLKSLQREIARFHTSVARSSDAAGLAQRDLQKNFINGINSIQGFSAELRTVRTTAESFTDSLERNKFSMREYFRYSAASTKTFGRFFRSELDTVNKVALENVKRLQTQYIKMGRDANGAMKAIAVMPTKLDLSNVSTQLQMAAQKQALFNQLVKQGSTNLLNFGKNTQWAGRQLMVGFTIPLIGLGTAATRTFMDMETAAIKFKKVYGDLFTAPQETQFALESIQLLGKEFTKYGIAVSDTVALAAEAAAAGFSGTDLQAQVTQATRLQVLGQVDQQKALETTISLQNAFRISSEQLAESINFLNAVENQTVVSLDDITTAIPKAAPIVRELGGDVKDLAFFMAAMKEGGINASEGANALKSGLASLINPTDKAKGMLMDMGINIDNIVESNVGNLKATVIEFAKALDGLSNLQRQRAIEQLFGKFQQARLSALFDNVIRDGNQASRVLDLASASMEDLAALAEKELGLTADSAMNKFRASIESLKISLAPIGKTFLEVITPLLDKLNGLLEWFNGLSDTSKKVITKVVFYLGALGPVLLMTVGLMANFIANGIKGLMLLRNGFLRLTGQSKVLGEQTNYLSVEQQNAVAAAASLEQSHMKLQQAFTGEAAAVRSLITEYQRMVTAQNAAATRFPGMMSPGFKAKGYSKGVVSVPGPKGAGDIVPAMLSPGEAVVPAEMVQRYAPLINAMISGSIPGFKKGKFGIEEPGTGSSGRVGKSGMTVPIPYLKNVSSAGGAVEFINIDPSDITNVTSIYTKEILKSAKVSISQVNREINNWRLANTDAIRQATNLVNQGVDAEVAFGPLISKFESDMQQSQGATSRFAETAKRMMPELQKDLITAQQKAKELGLNIKQAADATKLSQALPGNIAATGLATPGGYTRMAKVRQAGAAMLGKVKGISKYGIPGFMLPSVLDTQSRAYKMRSSQEHVSTTEVQKQNLEQQKVLRTQARKNVDALVLQTATAAGTASPSKRTIPIGEDIARGLQVGMMNQLDETRAVANRLSKEATTVRNTQTGKPITEKDVAAGKRLTGPQIKKMAGPLILPSVQPLPSGKIILPGQESKTTKKLILPGQEKPKGGLIIPGAPKTIPGPNAPLIIPSQRRTGGVGGGIVNPKTGTYFAKGAFQTQEPSQVAQTVAEGQQKKTKRFAKTRGVIAKKAGAMRGGGMGAGMGVSALVFALSMLPGKIGQLANAIMPAVFALQAFAMLASSIGGVAAAVVALGVGLFMLNQSAKKSAEQLKKSADLEAQARVGSAKSIQEYAEFTGRALPSAREFSRNNRQLISASGQAVERFADFYKQEGNTATQVINAAATRGPEVGVQAAAMDVAQRAAIFGLSPADIAANIKAASDLIGADQVELRAKVQEILAPNGQDITKEPLTVEARMNFLQESSKQNIQAIQKSIGELKKIKLPGLTGEDFGKNALAGITATSMGGIGSIRKIIGIGKRVAGGESFKQAATTLDYQELKQAAGYQQGINESYSGGFGSEAMGVLKQGARNVLGYNYGIDSLKEFNNIQTSVSSATMQLSIAFTQQKESLALLNQQYADGLITKEQYDAQMVISSENFAALGESSKTLITELNKIDKSGELSADALKGMGEEAFAALKKSNPALFKKLSTAMEGVDEASQIDIMMGYAQGSLTILDLARLPSVIDQLDGKSIEIQLNILQKEGISVGFKEPEIRAELDRITKEIENYKGPKTGPEAAAFFALQNRATGLKATLKQIEESKKVGAGGGFDTDATDASKAASGVGKLTDAYDKELERLKKKRDALKDVNDELDRQNQYQMKQMDLLNQAAKAKMTGDYLTAAALQQESMFEGAKFASQSKIIQMDQVLKTGEDIKGRISDTGKVTAGDKKFLEKLKSGNYQGISPIPTTPGVGFATSGVNKEATATQTAGGTVYNVTMNVSGGNPEEIATKVIAKIKTISNKNNKSNGVSSIGTPL